MCSSPGYGRFGGAVKRTRSRGLASHVSPNIGCRPRASFIRGRIDASPSITRGGSPVRESRTPGSVRGVFSNGHPYRDNRPEADMRHHVTGLRHPLASTKIMECEIRGRSRTLDSSKLEFRWQLNRKVARLSF